MTIEIVRRGVDPRTLPKQVTCSRCTSLLRYYTNDVSHSQDQRDLYSYIVCPVCKEYIYING